MKIPKVARQYLFFLFILIVYISFKAAYRYIIIQGTNQTHAENFQTRIPVCQTDYLGLSDYAKELCSEMPAVPCEMLTCHRLLMENESAYQNIRQLMSNHPRKTLSDSYFLSATSDCDKFKTYQGYRLRPMSDEEKEFPMAFNILTHTNAEQVERLLRALYRPQNVYCIHIDTKASLEFIDAVRSITKCFDNVFIASRLEAVVYWGYSRLQADINCMKDLVNTSIRWRYLINTAAQAYPVKTMAEMVRILKIYNGANDIEGIYESRIIRSRFQLEWKEVPDWNTVVMTGKLNPLPPHNIDIVRGSAYGIFSREFVEFILQDQRAIDLLNWSRTTLTPDELYWASLHHTYSNPHLHTPGGYNGYPENKPWLAVYAEWDDGECRGKMIRSVCVFGIEDLPRLVKRKEFFVNKFYTDFEPLALDCLEAWIQQKTTCPVPLDENFYKNLPFIRK